MVTRNHSFNSKRITPGSLYVEGDFSQTGHGIGFIQGLLAETDVYAEDMVREWANRVALALPQSIDNKSNAIRHVYEWGKVGTPEGRLFQVFVRRDGVGNKIQRTVDYRFKKSVIPVPMLKERINPNPELNRVDQRRYVFHYKAGVMESGRTVNIRPKNTQALVFPMGGGGTIAGGRNYYFSNVETIVSFAKWRGRFAGVFAFESERVAQVTGAEVKKDIEEGYRSAFMRTGKKTASKNVSLAVSQGYSEGKNTMAALRRRYAT